MLNSINRTAPLGRRDYAVLLLLARLGLRASEMAFLELDDINWKAGQLSTRGKAGRGCDLPLPVEVGKAIAAYLRNGRPQSTSRRVFLRAERRSVVSEAIGCSAPELMPLLTAHISFATDWPAN